MKKMNKKAFTLIELLVVVAVIGILVLLAAPRFIGHTERAKLTRIQHDVRVMEQEVGTVFVSNGDEFKNWEYNSKDLNQLIEENELYEKEGYATELDTTDGPYKIIPEKYKDKINTKLKGTFYANSGGKVYYEHGKEQGYSEEEVDDLTNNCDFIPIADADELNNVRYERIETYGKGTKWERECEGGLDKNYIQVRNVDLSEYSAEGWEPIGPIGGYDERWNPIGTFTGTYDGWKYVITNLEIKGEDEDFQGLFGSTRGATIRNVGLIDNKVTGRSYVGGLVGVTTSGTTIENSYATGSVTGTNEVGGLAGWALDTIIENSYVTGSVTGSSWDVGGLVGSVGKGSFVDYTMINNSYATGSVKGERSVGGLVGYTGYDTTEIINSYATGSVESSHTAGGLVGEAGIGTTISNSYATGDVTGSLWKVGGLVGEAEASTNISNSYATGSVEGRGPSVGGLVGEASGSANGMASGSATISNSYATGSVTGTRYEVGGLVGSTYDTIIENSYATGSVESSEYDVGGLVGKASYSIIENSYATGSVKGANRLGGLVGSAYENTKINNSYWDTVTTGQTSSYGQDESFGKITEEMKKVDTYEGWDFDTVWKIDGNDYPKLR